MKTIAALAVSLLIGAALAVDAPKADLGAIRSFVDSARYNDALPLARHAVVADAGSAAAHDLLGQALAGLNRPGSAIPEFVSAASIEPANTDYLVHLGEAQLGQFAQGLAAWTRIHGNSPMLGMLTSPIPGAQAGGSFRYSPEGGPVLGETDKLSEATRTENEARDPRFDPGRSNMGTLRRPVAAMNAKEREKAEAPLRDALKTFDRALAIDPGLPRALAGRAYALMGLMDYNAAGEAFEKAAAAAKTDATLYQMGAVAYTRADRPNDAIRAWERVAYLDPTRIEAYRGLQSLYRASGQDLWKADYYAAVELLLSGKTRAALEGLQRVTDLHPGYAPGWRATGSAYLALKDHKKAVECLAKAVAADPQDGLGEYELGAAYLLGGDTEDGHAHLVKAALLRPDYSPTWFALAQQAEKSGDPDTAIAMYERTLDGSPNWAEAQFNLGALFLEKRESAKAVEHLERYLALRPNAPDRKDVREAIEQVKGLSTAR